MIRTAKRKPAKPKAADDRTWKLACELVAQVVREAQRTNKAIPPTDSAKSKELGRWAWELATALADSAKKDGVQ